MSSYDFKENWCHNGSLQLTLDFSVREVNRDRPCQFTSIDCLRVSPRRSPRGTSTANLEAAIRDKIIIHDSHEYLVIFGISKTLKTFVIVEVVNAAGCVMPATFLNEIQYCMGRNIIKEVTHER
jgi:hypothetical protein